MCRLHEVAEVIVAAQTGINAVVVGDRIAVVGALAHIVLLDRIEPEGGDAEVGEVGETLLESL